MLTYVILILFLLKYYNTQNFMNYLQNPRILPMTYTIVEAYVKTGFNMMRDRNLEIVCTLRGSHSDPVRLR